MTIGELTQAAEMLEQCRARSERIEQLPPAIRPTSAEDAYAIQALVEGRSRYPVFGWKIAGTSPAGRAHIGVDRPIIGRLLVESVVPRDGKFQLGSSIMRCAEMEFAFRFREAIPPSAAAYTMDEVLAGVDALMPAIELPDSRFTHFEQVGQMQLIADNACAGAVVIGTPAPDDWRSLDLASFEIWGQVNSEPARPGLGANVLGDPLRALLWFVNEMSMLKIGIDAGQIVITGACVPPGPVEPGDHVIADFGALGHVSVDIQ